MSHRSNRFRFEATNTLGELQSGVIAADSEHQAASEIQRRGLFSLSISQDDLSLSSRRRTSQRDQAFGLRTLATLLAAGIPVSRIPTTLESLLPHSWQPTIAELRARLSEGRALASALESSPLGLPSEVIEIVRAGESAGQLASSVRIAADEMDTRVTARSALLGALAYPSVLALTATFAVALLVGVVLPRFARILSEAGGVLPPSTAALLDVARTARAAFVPSIVLLGVAALLGRRWLKSDSGRHAWHRMLLGVPVIGVIRRASASRRFCSALAALLKSGTPLAVALKHAAPASGDAHVALQVETARTVVIAGSSLSHALRSHPALPDSTLRLIQVGEASGDLVRMLAHCSGMEQERAQMRTKSLMRLIEPTLILFFGGIVALIAAALLQALYSLTPGT